MFVRARIDEGVQPDAILIPQQGVSRTPRGDATVLIVNDKSQVEARPVVASQAIGDTWLISEGLKSGDQVIVSGLQKARPGEQVKATTDNWLLRKLSTIYIEIFRNIPPLLQIFFWYFAVLRNLPGPRQAVSAFDLAFLSNRGLYIPSPQLGDGFIAFILAVVMAIVLSVGLFRFNKTYQIKTGQLRRTWPIAAVLIIGLPLLAQWLFGAALHWDVPALQGFNFRGGMVLIPELAALTLALSVYTSAFIAEIIRAGIQAVPYGQHEAARSLGLPNPVTLRQVIIPQALRVIIPPLTSQYLNIVKNSSLAAAIGYPDMVSLFAGTVLNQTGQAIETIAMTMSVYLIISLTISLLMNIHNRRIAIVER